MTTSDPDTRPPLRRIEAAPRIALPAGMRLSLKLLIAGVAIIVGGAAPLWLYVQFGPRDGNPIGLGLLFVGSVPLGGLCLLLALIRFLVERSRKPGAAAGGGTGQNPSGPAT